MNIVSKSSLVACSLLMLSNASFTNYTNKTVKKEEEPFKYKFSGSLKTGDTYYGKNISLLNNCEREDQIFVVKNQLTINADVSYLDLIKGRLGLKTKAAWGSPEIASTTTAQTKILDAVGQDHKHYIPRHFFWMYEVWLEFSLTEALGIHSAKNKHTFTCGAFPFELGRGIALGSSYAVSPDYLGFWSDSVVDQFAWGAKFSGNLHKKLAYDVYAGLLDNQTYSLSKTGEKILGQQYGKLKNPERGFGNINYVFAGRLLWTPIDDEQHGKLTFEPYFLINKDPEQDVEFLADATSNLTTIGLAHEYIGDRFEFGFDAAVNFGKQNVKGWDRNVIETDNLNGNVRLVNSHVYVNSTPTASANPSAAYKVPYVGTGIKADGTISTAGSNAQTLINNSAQSEFMNSKSIGIATDLDEIVTIPSAVSPAAANELFNANNRFRDPYCNKYKGFMLVSDMSTSFNDKALKIAATIGYASGDIDPNSDQKDGDYRGFIGLQETYSGKRVRSAFYLGSAGKLRLPLDTPASELQPDRFGSLTSGFSNLALIGSGITWEPKDWEKSFSINPNIIGFWQTYSDKKFDLATKTTLSTPSSSFLGIEVNVFIKKELIKNLSLFGIASIFVPGSHFDDVKGKPMNAKQFKILDRLDTTGYNGDAAPGLGNDISYTFNAGLEYKF